MDSPGFPNLEELSVAALTDESRIISDDHLQRILKSSSKLKLLDVRNCTRLTHESLIRLPAWDIKHLFLSGCSVTRDVGWVQALYIWSFSCITFLFISPDRAWNWLPPSGRIVSLNWILPGPMCSNPLIMHCVLLPKKETSLLWRKFCV